jgi:putative toxin-antitoxin system antitoxin component (TIGR02293 family)
MSTAAVKHLERRVAKQTVEQAREALGLNYVELAAALGVDRRTILRYRTNSSAPSPRVQARMEKMREISYLLEQIFAGQQAQTSWLYSPVPMLRDRRPIQLLREGELDRVLSVLAGIYTGATS